MCTVCGCGEGETRIEGQGLEHDHDHAHGHHHHHHDHEHGHAHSHDHGHHHDHDHEHSHAHDHGHHQHTHGDHHDYGQGPAHAHAPGMSQSRMVQIEQDILGKNNQYAAANRQLFQERQILALNLVSSPGSGKTSLLTRSIDDLKGELPITVIEGDQQTANDADRIRETGVSALQINTGKGCHLDAHMIGHAMESLQPADNSLLFIENVGNLVCPAAFDLGEAHKVAILSVTEGEDKPLKYPDMFHAADLMILNKTDLLPYLDFDVNKCIEFARRVNPDIEVLQLSAKSGEGMDAWYQWIRSRMV
ncbi:hydrogenase nickel incorporation protein HypB [Sedimenticola selenatireducens]|uniref:Hydrogenase maturation factor HypB n=1 Tax=Sedimenticola selenatireducens TaxID=191960 RepID=A0A2N6CTD0_9GAMM|nr:hydrogenase nickel incorporation protein HypB [Sedimenticola selenatireducens]PLX60354.1 MAG: hydrogenase accessory protein HypB [Sedimenticola selenatireducens]